MKYSNYQQDVFKAVITTPANIAVKATAGSGKTTTIVEAAKLIPYGKSAIFAAFNKETVKQLALRLPEGVDCATLHSIGMSAIRAHYFPGKVIMKEKKQLDHIIPLYENIEISNKEKWTSIYLIDRLLSLCRATMTIPTKEAFEKLATNYALDVSDVQVEKGVQALKNLYTFNDNQDRFNMIIDFQDMIEMCVRSEKIRLPQYDFVFVDEIQDLSALDHLFIKKLRKVVGGRIIGVGDPRQSIYGFRGSHPYSFDKFTEEANTTILPLSISYRCDKAIVAEARKIYTDIEPYVENQEGLVTMEGSLGDIREGDFVLCRNTRPLIEVFFTLIDRNIKAYVVGSEMEKGLKNLLSSCEPTEDSELALGKVKAIYEKLLASLKLKGATNPSYHPKAVSFKEKLDILKLLFSRFNTVLEVEKFIETVFDDKEREGVRLMTIHKSKGMENGRVFVIDSFDGKQLIPSPYAVTRDQKIQERNLSFVAVTRAKNELIKLSL